MNHAPHSGPDGTGMDHGGHGHTATDMTGMDMADPDATVATDMTGMDMTTPEAGPATDMTGMDMTTPEAGPAMDMTAMDQATPVAHFFGVIILGVWLATSPFALGYDSTALSVSDVISGLLVIGLAVVTLTRKPTWAPWAASLVGVWLLFAPLVFKAPTAAAFTNDTLVGILVIALVLLMPGMPGMNMNVLPGPDRPPGWSYNPSTWVQRAPIIALALVGFFLSRQMSAYQLGYTRSVWEPFFTPGTKGVLTSEVSKSFPISDAGLGAVAYIVEAIMGFMGGKARWRTMPWMVAFFGVLVVPLCIASIVLIMLQPVSVGTWCTPCLLAALAMLIMIALTLDEVVATIVFLARARREGQSVWKVFWGGGTLADTAPDPESVRPDALSVGAMVWGVALPWNLLASIGVGLWLMSSPAIFGTVGGAADSDHIFGALAVTVAFIALAEVGRVARFLNIALGAWIIASPWLLSGGGSAARWTDVAAGTALIALSLRRGPVREQYGSFQHAIR